MVHCSGISGNFPTVIGNNVVLGSGSIIHGCTIEDGSYIGEGAQVLDGAKLASGSILLAGALLPAGKVVPAGQVWGGVPAVFQRVATEVDRSKIAALVEENALLAAKHAQETSKDWETIEDEEADYQQERERSPHYYPRLTPEELSQREGEIENHAIPGRILDSPGTFLVPLYSY